MESWAGITRRNKIPKVVRKLSESTVSTNKKSCQIKGIVVCIDVTYRWHYSLMSSKMEVYE